MRSQITSLFAIPNRRLMLTGIAALGLTGAWATLRPVSAQDNAETLAADVAHDMAIKGDIILVDIRTPQEWLETGVGDGAIALDMRENNFVPTLAKLRQANPDTPIALICRSGNRSGYVTTTLRGQGFTGLLDVTEGMLGGRNGTGWVNRGLPTYAGTPGEITPRLASALEK